MRSPSPGQRSETRTRWPWARRGPASRATAGVGRPLSRATPRTRTPRTPRGLAPGRHSDCCACRGCCAVHTDFGCGRERDPALTVGSKRRRVVRRRVGSPDCCRFSGAVAGQSEEFVVRRIRAVHPQSTADGVNDSPTARHRWLPLPTRTKRPSSSRPTALSSSVSPEVAHSASLSGSSKTPWKWRTAVVSTYVSQVRPSSTLRRMRAGPSPSVYSARYSAPSCRHTDVGNTPIGPDDGGSRRTGSQDCPEIARTERLSTDGRKQRFATHWPEVRRRPGPDDRSEESLGKRPVQQSIGNGRRSVVGKRKGSEGTEAR